METYKNGLGQIRILAIEIKKGLVGNQVQRWQREEYAEKLNKIVKMAEFLVGVKK